MYCFAIKLHTKLTDEFQYNVLTACFSIRPQIIQCIIPPTLNKRGVGPCRDQAEFNFAENQVVRRLSALQEMCGAGTPVSTTNRRTNSGIA